MHTNKKATSYWHRLEDGRIQCDLCPRKCKLKNGQRGFCYVRGAENGAIVLYAYGMTTGLAVDPIEKKPLYHFYPGSKVLSFGTVGCNLSCRFCQNWQISSSGRMESMQKATPEEIVKRAKNSGAQTIAFTYNDPVVFMEFARDVAQAALKRKIATVAVTAGYISEKARPEFFSFINAANVDLKAFSDDFYRKFSAARLQPVLDTLRYIREETNVWLEVTTLLIPGLNDSDYELHALSEWLVENLGPDVPLHFSAFHPDHKMTDRQRTPLSTLEKARLIAFSKGLNFVYTGNVYDPDGSATHCPDCGQVLIERNGYQTLVLNMTLESACSNCGARIVGVFASK